MKRIDCLSQLRNQIVDGIEKQSESTFVPTGLQEEVVYWVGKGEHHIILALHANDAGKTTAGVNILRNIIWDHDHRYFSYWDGYSVFRDKSWHLKKFRIASIPKNLVESAAIQTEIKRWWPRNRYQWEKGGQKFPSQCTCDNGWTGDCFSYNQKREDFESIKLSFMWFDEPGRPDLIGACTSRFANDGMLWLITATPYRAGAFLDVIDDLSERSIKVKTKKLTGTADDNSITKGKPNHLGTKRGLRTDEEIQIKKDICPPDEYGARIEGKADYKMGRIYYDFDQNFHVKDYDLNTDYFKKANCFTVIDPHDKAYPFIQMWALLPDGLFVLYNEWPTFETLGKNYYDEMRVSTPCNYNVEQISRFIKIYEGSQYGLHTVARFMDPRFGKAKEGTIIQPEGWCSQFAKHELVFSFPVCQKIEIQRDRIRTLLRHDTQNPFEIPMMAMMPHNVNSIRMFSRHYWEDEGVLESEQYKEGPDCTRVLHAGLEGTKFIDFDIVNKNKKETKMQDNPIIKAMKEMAEIKMG